VAAPSGSKWVYRINQDRRRCWYLSSKAIGGHRTQSGRAAPVRSRHLAGDADALQQGQRRNNGVQAVPIGKTDAAIAVEPPAIPQPTTPSVEQSSANLAARSVPTVIYKVVPTPAKTFAAPTVRAEHVAERAPTGATHTTFILLSGAAAAALLFAGGTFHVSRRARRRACTSVAASRHANKRPAVIRSPAAAKRSPFTTDPADDLKRSLLELKRDLKNVSKIGSGRSSRQRGSSSGAISLPPTAAWLTRTKAKPTMEQQLADA
jgi:hypothetical protein